MEEVINKIEYMPVILTYKENRWLDRQMDVFDALFYDDSSTHAEWREAFEYFYDGICLLYRKYPTKHLSKMVEMGIGYDGIIPGNDLTFEQLYYEMISMIRDKIVDKPIRYYANLDGEKKLIEELESGKVKILKEFTVSS